MNKNSSDAAYERDLFIAEFLGCNCYEDQVCTLDEYDESISEIQAMLDYSIDLGNKNEIAFWRRQLQKVRVQKRRAKELAKIIENMAKEAALA